MSRSSVRVATTVLGLIALAGLAAFGISRARVWRSTPAVGQGEFVLFVLGGSTAAGEPYEGRTDLGEMVRAMFGGALAGRPIRVVNLGRGGRASSEVVQDARQIADQPPPAGAAVAFLYAGNNEFLRFDRAPDLSRHERSPFDVPTVGDAERRGVLRTYERSLTEIIERLQRSGVPVIAVTSAVNLEWDPNRSVLQDPRNVGAARAALDRGDAERAAGHFAAALAAYEALLGLEPRFALASFRAAQCLQRLGRVDEARRRYLDAVEFDGNPYRETPSERQILLAVARRTGVRVVDAGALLAAVSPAGIAGFNIFWDNCHPTLDGYLRIAAGLAAELAHLTGMRDVPASIDARTYERALGWTAEEQADVLASRGEYCYRAAILTWDRGPRLERAADLLDQAARLHPGFVDIVASQAVLAAVGGDSARSVEVWRQAWALDPRAAEARAASPQVQQLLRGLGIADLLARVRSAPTQ